MPPTLDADELSFLRQAFRSSRRIPVSMLVHRLEEMDYLLDGDAKDLIRSVVPKAYEEDKLTLQDAIKVATSAKSQDSGEGQPTAALGREDSLAELENSFNQQMQSGGIPVTVSEGEPPPPPPSALGRDDSLAQLERSFEKQVRSGDIPEVIHEAEEGGGGGGGANGIGHGAVVGVDVPIRRRTISGDAVKRGMPQRSDTLSVFARKYPEGPQGPSPQADDVPHRRARSTPHLGQKRGMGGLVGLDEAFAEDSTMSGSPDLTKQTSEEALLETAADTLGVNVEVSNLPMRRKAMAVSKSWSEAVAEVSSADGLDGFYHVDIDGRCGRWDLMLKVERVLQKDDVIAALDSRRLELEKEAEEALRIRQEVAACVVWLAEESKMRFTLSEARESADRAASEAMDQLKRAEESHARAEVETVLRLALDSLERDAMIAAVEAASKEAKRKSEQEAKALAAEAESRVIKETAAREEAQKKAEEAERQADEAVRRAEAVESEARQREDSLRAAVLEAESKALEERDAALKAMGDEKEAVERARQEAIREMMMWKEKFEKMQQGLESDATGENVEKSSVKPVNFNANEQQRHHFDSDGSSANVSYEAIGPSGWWQCLVCSPNTEPTIEDYPTRVEKAKSESRMYSGSRAASMGSMRSDGRPSSDVCSIM